MRSLTIRPSQQAARTWAPLALQWFIRGVEIPTLLAVAGHLGAAKPTIAAFGSVVVPTVFLFEGPAIALLPTCLAKAGGRARSRALLRFAAIVAVLLLGTQLILLVPAVGNSIATGALGVTPAISRQARQGLLLLLPWGAIAAFRAYTQASLLARRAPTSVGIASTARVAATTVVLLITSHFLDVMSAGLLSLALLAGAVIELIVLGISSQFAGDSYGDSSSDPHPFKRGELRRFFLPIAAVPLLALTIPLIIVAAISRLPSAEDSLAAWPIAFGTVFLLRGPGLAFGDACLSLLKQEVPRAEITRLRGLLVIGMMTLCTVMAIPPIGGPILGTLYGVYGNQRELVVLIFAVGSLGPFLAVVQGWYQSQLFHRNHSMPLLEATIAAVVVVVGLGCTAPLVSRLPGAITMMAIYVLSQVTFVAWMRMRLDRASLE